MEIEKNILGKVREEVVNAIGLEDYDGEKEIYIIRNSNGIIENGINFSDEVDEILSIFRKLLVEIEVNIESEWQDLKGEWLEERFNGQKAYVIQHEMDHLEGKLVCD